MKKIIAFLSAAVLMLSFTACGNNKEEKTDKSPDVKAIVEDVKGKIEFTDLENVDDDTFDTFYDIKKDMYDSYCACYAGSGGSADEIAVFKAKDSDSAQTIKKALDDRVSKRAKDFAGYAPDEEEKIKNSVVKIKGNYVFLCISPDSAKAGQIFEDSFK